MKTRELPDGAIAVFLVGRGDIAERVAAQMNCSIEEAIAQMSYWDRFAVETFCIGNGYPRKELH